MEYLRANTTARPLGVDREAGMIRGVILAEEGPFKSQGRGEFDSKSISQIVRLARLKPNGLRSRFTHPDLSSDGLGKYTGRTRNIRREKITREVNGEPVEVAAVRGDHVFSKSAYATPNGDLATYLMDLAEEDGEALGMSLVLETDEEFRLDAKGNPKIGENGEPLPPLWRPTSLHAVDFVDTGDATNSLLGHRLSIDGLPDEVVRKAEQLLRQQFQGKDRGFVEARLRAWVDRVLDHHWPIDEDGGYGDAEALEATQDLRRRWEFQQLLLTRCE